MILSINDTKRKVRYDMECPFIPSVGMRINGNKIIDINITVSKIELDTLERGISMEEIDVSEILVTVA